MVECIRSIVKLTKDIDYEVIVADNNSDPEFKEIIISGADLDGRNNFHFLPLPGNMGFGRANNEGLKIATGRNILFLNPDTILLNNAVKILSDFLDEHKEAGACGGNLFDSSLKPTYSFWHTFPGVWENLDGLLKYQPTKVLFKGNATHNFTQKSTKVAFIIGADLMVKKTVLDQTGAFDADYFMFMEEADLCKRIRKQGYSIYNVPEAHIQHLESGSFEKNEIPPDHRINLVEKSRRIYMKKNHGRLYHALSDLTYYLFLDSRILLLKDDKKREYFKKRKQFYKEKSS